MWAFCSALHNSCIDHVDYIVADIFDEVDAQLEEYGIVCECVGGGTILHDPEQKSLQIFGRSQVNESVFKTIGLISFVLLKTASEICALQHSITCSQQSIDILYHLIILVA